MNIVSVKNDNKNGRTSIELCAGCGGLSLGLELAGFKHELLVDNNKQAIETLNENFNTTIWNRDIATITDKEILKFKDVSLLSAGIPCQPFSFAGKGKGFEDTRGTLFHDYIRITKILQPRVLLIENVKGLLSHDKGSTFNIIKNTIEEIGYHVVYKLLNANDFGVPQKRIRIFILGFKNKKDVDNFEWPIKDDYKPVLRDVIFGLENNMEGSNYSEKKKRIFNMIKPGGNWKSLPVDEAKEYMKKVIIWVVEKQE